MRAQKQNVLTINPGSTAVKYVLFNGGGSVLEQKTFDRKENAFIDTSEIKWLKSLEIKYGKLHKIGIRIVHGGEIEGPVILDFGIKKKIKDAAQFAPIHNNIALDCISILENIFSDIVIIASFDTDFHSTIPVYARTYPISAQLNKELKIRKYGFHGIALRSVLGQLKEVEKNSGKTFNKIICAHLGGGCSVTAVKNYKSVDTSMGMTPLDGLMMITRSGSVDPGVVKYISDVKGWNMDKVIGMLNTKSGFYGMTGSKNTIDIIDRASKHEEPEKIAFDMFVDRVVKYIFSYYGVLQGCDAFVFSGGMGARNAYLRASILSRLSIININEKNSFVFESDEAGILFEDVLST